MDNTSKNVPLTENGHVKELLGILRDNGKDADGLQSLIGYVASLEKHVQEAAAELQSVRHELRDMREEQGHPMRTAMQRTARSMEHGLAGAQNKIDALKTQITNGCKAAVEAFKQAGISALDGISKFFRIKPALESLRDDMRRDIQKDMAAIAKIEAVSTEYHQAGNHLKNMARRLRGQEPLEAVKPNGKLAKLLEAPFRSEMKSLSAAVKDLDKAIAAIERLDKAAHTAEKATEIPAEHADKPVVKLVVKPSVRKTMKDLQSKIDTEKQEKPADPKLAAVKVKQAGAEL